MTSTSAPSRKTLSKIACNRLQKELVEWQSSPPAGFKQKPTDNLQRWIIEAVGAPGTLYAGETYQLQVDFPEHYPMEAPQHSLHVIKLDSEGTPSGQRSLCEELPEWKITEGDQVVVP